MEAKYQVYKDVAGKFRFRLRSANDRIVVVSEAYEHLAGALNGVQSIQNNCIVQIEDLTEEGPRITYPKYQVFTDAGCKYRFRLTASNGQIIGASEAYETKEGVLNGIKEMQASCNAEIEQMTCDVTPSAATEAISTPEMPTPPPPPPEPVMEQTAPATQATAEMKTSPPPEPMMQETAVTTAATTEMEMPTNPQTGETKLEFQKLPEKVTKGDVVYFKGKLSRGKIGIPKAKIRIFEHDRSFMLDAAWADGYTEEDGSFNLSAKVTPPHFWDNKAKLYAQADTDAIKQLRSEIQQITIE